MYAVLSPSTLFSDIRHPSCLNAGMDVLLLEDEPAIRSALGRALGRWGHQVMTAGSIAEARSSAVERPPQALISDLKLPDGSGLDLAIDLGLPFILMSGYGSFEDATRALRHGCVDFLTKPVALEQLKGALQRLSDEPTSQAPLLISGRESCVVVRAQAGSLQEQDMVIHDWSWQDASQAQELFAACPGDLRQRRVVAELMQIPGAQRLVLNNDSVGWRAWLPLTTDWQDEEELDRRQLISDLTDRCWWRPQGLLLECRHAS